MLIPTTCENDFFQDFAKEILSEKFQVHTPNVLDKNVRVSKIQLVISQKQMITLKKATPDDDLTVHHTFDSSAPVDWTVHSRSTKS